MCLAVDFAVHGPEPESKFMARALQNLIQELSDLHGEMIGLVQENAGILDQISAENRASAMNLLHYLALRRHDIRGLQDELAELGLSSLGRTEPHVMASVQSVMNVLSTLNLGQTAADSVAEGCRDQGRKLLERNAELFLGSAPEGRTVRIMVTMPSEAATNYELVRELVVSGMNCMRINCAHDGEDEWAAMIRNLRRAEEETGLNCKVEMDLAGPKLRTGPIACGAAVVKYRPKRDVYGRVEEPARIWLTPAAHPEAPPSDADAVIPASARWIATLGPRDKVHFVDTRGARRSLTIVEAAGASRWAEGVRTAYVAQGMTLTATYHDKAVRRRTKIGTMSGRPQVIRLRKGDTLILTRSLEPGHPARTGTTDENGATHELARIGVTLPEFFDSVQPGQPIWLDDGKIGGTVTQVSADEVEVEITHAKPEGDKLGAEKGINIPETALNTSSLTEDDEKALAFAAKHADIVGYSFVRTEEDVRLLQARLARRKAEHLSILLKIETREGFDNLPALLLAALRTRSVGVMIARGDLAIECGFERMAEAQEEILWISEAAHVPVVWATQVLESLAKSGTPSRSEITDAAMGERAECVMLNKGPYVAEAVRTLDDIMRRMQQHQQKRRSMLRKLGMAAGYASQGARRNA
jgi:pyruvate kinase